MSASHQSVTLCPQRNSYALKGLSLNPCDDLNSIRRVARLYDSHLPSGRPCPIGSGPFVNDRAIEMPPSITLGDLVNSIIVLTRTSPRRMCGSRRQRGAAAVLDCYFFLYAGFITARADSRLLWFELLMWNPIFVVSNRFLCHAGIIKRVYRTSFGGKALSRRK